MGMHTGSHAAQAAQACAAPAATAFSAVLVRHMSQQAGIPHHMPTFLTSSGNMQTVRSTALPYANGNVKSRTSPS